ncbi:DUF6383 domain-containing protein [Parabacteroides chongii]|uniref:DUF6383 domain-containing protein n=1 Tax=Parabacteroides chongii TaxID=2685834 RepID=UPI00240D26DD|nr:DUF6383 domain-containing protein [Parabacteroides chongii]WFE85737.1 DUF6383 domain-containing protein [Parabacteroides chongii]
MNKKFSTLVASVLLAGAVGTVGAVVPYNSYVKSAGVGTQAETVVNGVSYQLTSGTNVLVMQEQSNGTMALKMVAADEADLMSSLWTIVSEDDGEGGVSYTFINKATGLPLAFDTKDAKLGGANATNAMGNVSLWKWRTGTSVKGAKDLVSYFHKDSALVLENNGGAISAKKVYAKTTTPSSSFTVDAYQAEEVVLGVDALNSMLGIQPTDGKMKLGFTRDQLNGVENIWLKEYTAVTALGESVVAKAAQAAAQAAKNVNTPSGVADAIIATITPSYTAAQKEIVYTIATEAAKGSTVTEAKTKATAAVGKYTSAQTAATHEYDYAVLQQTAINALTAATYAEFVDAVDGASVTTASLQDDAKDLVAEAGYSLTAAKTAIQEMEDEYVAKKASADQKKAIRDLIDAEIDKASSANYGDFIVALKAINLPAVDQTIFNDLKAKIVSVEEAACNGGGGTFDLTTAKTAAKATLVDYDAAAATAATNLTDVQAINTEVKALTGVNSKADYDAAVEAVAVGASSATADEMKAVQKAMKALVAGPGFVKPTAEAVLAVVRSFEDAKLAATEANTIATTVGSAVAGYNGDKAQVLAAINATKQSYYSTEENDAVTAIHDAANAKTAVAEVIDAAVEKAAEYVGASADYVSLASNINKTDASKTTYLRVDTTYLTTVSSDKYQLAFAVGTFNSALKNSKKQLVDARLQEDFNGRYSFKFTYYPTQDSLMIEPASYIYPFTDKAYADITNTEVATAKAKPEYAGQQVKLAILAKDHREVTVGVADKTNTSTSATTINTRIYLGGNSNYERTTLASGVYFFNLVTDLKSRMDDNGKYRVATYCGDNWKAYENEETTQRFGKAQDFNHMPRTQWVVEQNEGVAGIQTVTITNREFGVRYNNVQLYKAGDNVFAQVGAFANTSVIDTLAYTKVADKYTSDKYLGYKKFEKALDYEKFYNLDYLSGMELGNYVSFKGDSSVYVDLKGGKTFIEFVPASEDTEFGYASTKAGAVQLYKAAYALRVHNETLLTTGSYYVTVGKDGKSYVITHETSGITPSYFVLKENNELVSEEGDTTCYYALQQVSRYVDDKKFYVNSDWNRVGVRDASMAFTVEESCYLSPEKRIATFAVVEDNTPLYRRLGVSKADDGFQDMTVQNGKIYTVNSAAKEYLYEDATSKYSAGKNINFLGLEGKGVDAKSAMFVDTAYVRGNTNMPQYMLVMNPQIVKADTVWCNATSTHKHATLADSLACPHTTITPASITGRYLINAEDSVAAGDNNYVWNTKYTRLAFVDAKHIGDTLVIFRNGKASTAAKDSIFLGNNDHNKVTTARPNGIKNPVFAFRLVNADACDFLIESAGDHKIPSDGTGKWVAIKNGVPVVAAMETYTDAIRDAEIFNIEPTDEVATSTDAIEAGEVSVIATDGAVIVKGAAGKNVIISNVLGQTIANTVLSSDEATIAAPKGYVTVAVEGEKAVKAIVK